MSFHLWGVTEATSRLIFQTKIMDGYTVGTEIKNLPARENYATDRRLIIESAGCIIKHKKTRTRLLKHTRPAQKRGKKVGGKKGKA